ncbi:MAG: glucans biosynthesis glucosyltransferase MdoH [Hyphomicrobiaceae bacterium]
MSNSGSVRTMHSNNDRWMSGAGWHQKPAPLMPNRTPMSMPDQDFHAASKCRRTAGPVRVWLPRFAVMFATTLITAIFASELYAALAGEHITPLQVVFLVLSTLAFSWIALGTMSAALGYVVLVSGERPDTLQVASQMSPLKTRTALLFPVYHEEVEPIAGVIEAIAKDLAHLGEAANFDVFVLSDTRGAEDGDIERQRYSHVCTELADVMPVYYRRRDENYGRKAGNIKDWVENYGAAYEHFVILDADSIMSGKTLVRLAQTMEETPTAGLVQTVPRLIGARTVLQRLQQYASNIYGPAVASGLAFWHRDEGNYWGHNAIIRTDAFASAAGLPPLPGQAPFGGHIQSHDFVEAVLLQRAGWGVHMVPTIEGSYEGLPPNLLDVVQRDRRWAQGNLQHLSIVSASGLTTMGRVHLAMGALSFIVSGIWAVSLVVGILLALQGQQMIPTYFADQQTLFPIWPILDSTAALRLFCATVVIVLLPKVFGLVLEIQRTLRAKEPFGVLRAFAGVTTETFFSVLLAPILMVTQSVAIVQVCLGKDSGWKAQHRQDGRLTLSDAFVYHWRHTVIGIVAGLVCWHASGQLVLWMLPVLVGLVCSAPLSWFMARQGGSFFRSVLSIPEQRTPPQILNRALSYGARWTTRFEMLAEKEANVNRAAEQTELEKAA